MDVGKEMQKIADYLLGEILNGEITLEGASNKFVVNDTTLGLAIIFNNKVIHIDCDMLEKKAAFSRYGTRNHYFSLYSYLQLTDDFQKKLYIKCETLMAQHTSSELSISQRKLVQASAKLIRIEKQLKEIKTR
jgi:hypothetical protein